LSHGGAVGMGGFDRPENHTPPPSAAPPSQYQAAKQAASVGKSEHQGEQTRASVAGISIPEPSNRSELQAWETASELGAQGRHPIGNLDAEPKGYRSILLVEAPSE
jgi:hypothetical protein